MVYNEYIICKKKVSPKFVYCTECHKKTFSYSGRRKSHRRKFTKNKVTKKY